MNGGLPDHVACEGQAGSCVVHSWLQPQACIHACLLTQDFQHAPCPSTPPSPSATVPPSVCSVAHVVASQAPRLPAMPFRPASPAQVALTLYINPGTVTLVVLRICSERAEWQLGIATLVKLRILLQVVDAGLQEGAGAQAPKQGPAELSELPPQERRVWRKGGHSKSSCQVGAEVCAAGSESLSRSHGHREQESWQPLSRSHGPLLRGAPHSWGVGEIGWVSIRTPFLVTPKL